ncbi:uncharacterized protein LOC143838899 [Paroedura picta]|uniref:uncharacterized protein LOC143838899 n=1 Tax=Paroedura picta TaxID=143630 RepID=UPI004056421D
MRLPASLSAAGEKSNSPGGLKPTCGGGGAFARGSAPSCRSLGHDAVGGPLPRSLSIPSPKLAPPVQETTLPPETFPGKRGEGAAGRDGGGFLGRVGDRPILLLRDLPSPDPTHQPARPSQRERRSAGRVQPRSISEPRPGQFHFSAFCGGGGAAGRGEINCLNGGDRETNRQPPPAPPPHNLSPFPDRDADPRGWGRTSHLPGQAGNQKASSAVLGRPKRNRLASLLLASPWLPRMRLDRFCAPAKPRTQALASLRALIKAEIQPEGEGRSLISAVTRHVAGSPAIPPFGRSDLIEKDGFFRA